MNSYKIINVTNLVGRRDSKYNTIVDIEYIDNRVKKNIKLKPGETIYLTISSLPLSIHRLRVKNLINISEVSAAEVAKTMEKERPKTIKNVKKTKKPVVVPKKLEPVTSTRKKTTKKKTTESKITDDK